MMSQVYHKVGSEAKSRAALIPELQTEIFRKGIHLLIGLVPTLAGINRGLTLLLLAAGTLLYAFAEFSRLRGVDVAIISQATRAAARRRDQGHFVLGPITLGIGAMLALMLYPHAAATIGIYALAFGDGLASLAGKMIGRIRIPLTGGKTFAGSAACFVAVFIVGLVVTGNVPVALALAAAATLLEVLPSGDLDNLLLPVGTGFIAALIV